MSWFKVDDGLHSHPKWLAAPLAARGLWVTAGSWSAQHLTDGFIPRHVLKTFGAPPHAARALVSAGLWLEVEGGWKFHDWEEFQPTAASVKAERAASTERQRRAREKARNGGVTRDSDVTSGEVRRESQDPDPTRPDPTVLTLISGDTQEVPAEVWTMYAQMQRARSRVAIGNVRAYEKAVALQAKAEHSDTAARWLSDFNVTPREVAAALVDGKAGHTWTRREETA